LIPSVEELAAVDAAPATVIAVLDAPLLFDNLRCETARRVDQTVWSNLDLRNRLVDQK